MDLDYLPTQVYPRYLEGDMVMEDKNCSMLSN